MSPAPRKCPGGCGQMVYGVGVSCDPCWYRVPRELRDEFHKSKDLHNVVRPKNRIRKDIMDWWRTNPAPQSKDSTPAWKRHKQQEK